MSVNFFKEYRRGIDTHFPLKRQDDIDALSDWWSQDGRNLFINAFESETKIKIKSVTKEGAKFRSALPKSLSDWKKKIGQDQYYAANANWFIDGADYVFKSINKNKGNHPTDDFYKKNIMSVLHLYLLDSKVLFEDFATDYLETPGIYGISKSRRERTVYLYHAALQAIFSRYSPVTFSDPFPDSAIALIRMCLEMRIRYGFGVLGKVDNKNGGVAPVMLSELLEAIREKEPDIRFSVPLADIERAYGWANLYLHAGVKSYIWCSLAALKYLQPLLTGGPYTPSKKSPSSKGAASSIYAGIQTKAGIIHQIQSLMESQMDKKKFSLITIEPKNCDAIIL